MDFYRELPGKSADRAFERSEMVKRQILARGVSHPVVLAAMGKVPRHLFVDGLHSARAYEDHPLAIGQGQTISQPYIVAVMTELCDLDPKSRVLEIGTGSGYQTAVLAEIAGEVFTVERIEKLGEAAKSRLDQMGYRNIRFRTGDGTKGWPDEAPFDAILVTAAPPSVPPSLIEQLAPGGRLVIPVGTDEQILYRYVKNPDGTLREELICGVIFVPLIPEE